MSDHGSWAWPAAIAVACIAASAVAIADSLADKEQAPHPDIDRACRLAAGNARVHASWLAPGHGRREAGLLLLAGDAAWAPLCAKDERAGEQLRNEILAAVGAADALGADLLAQRLLTLLETR